MKLLYLFTNNKKLDILVENSTLTKNQCNLIVKSKRKLIIVFISIIVLTELCIYIFDLNNQKIIMLLLLVVFLVTIYIEYKRIKNVF